MLQSKLRCSGHLGVGVLMGIGGGVGISSFWEEFGVVGRGLTPFALLVGGLVMVGAGVQSLREQRGETGRRALWGPAASAAACLLLALAAMVGSGPDAATWIPERVIGYIALGLISGVIGGMLGLGGGIVHLAGMTLFFDFPFAFARGATLINNVFICGAAAARYGRRGLLLWDVVSVMLPCAIIGVGAGTVLQGFCDEVLMGRVFAVFIVLISAAIAVDTIKLSYAGKSEALVGDSEGVAPKGRAPGSAAVGAGLAGLASGVLGISGGVVLVPSQTLWTRIPLRRAIANSTLVTCVSSAAGVLITFAVERGSVMSHAEMATIALLFVPGNLIGGHLGALWMEKLPTSVVRTVFVVALFALAYRVVANA